MSHQQLMWNTFTNATRNTLASRIMIQLLHAYGKTFFTHTKSLLIVGTADSIKGLNYCTTLDTISSEKNRLKATNNT
jgi:hypothetical protein